VPKLALFAKPKPARQYHLARRGTARSLQFAQPGTPTFPRSCSLPSGATFFAHHVMPRGRGWTNQEYAYLAQALMETSEHPRTQSSARTRQVRPSRWVCTNSSRRRTRCTKTGIPALSGTFAIAGVRGGVQVNLRPILARPFVGRFAAPSQIVQTSNCPLDMPHVAGICESTASRRRCSWSIATTAP
jgi:hypothetical protein